MEAGVSNIGILEVFSKVGAASVSVSIPSIQTHLAHLNSLSSSTTCTPCSKFAVPFWPTDAKWPLTAILSGAVYDRLTVMRLTAAEAGVVGDWGLRSEAMTKIDAL